MKKNIVTATILGGLLLSGCGEVTQQPYSWTIEGPVGVAEGSPHSSVTLRYKGKLYPLGTYSGACGVIPDVPVPGPDPKDLQLMPGEKTGVMCWYAGGGDELGLYEENGKAVVKSGSLAEPTATTPFMRTSMNTIMDLD